MTANHFATPRRWVPNNSLLTTSELTDEDHPRSSIVLSTDHLSPLATLSQSNM